MASIEADRVVNHTMKRNFLKFIWEQIVSTLSLLKALSND